MYFDGGPGWQMPEGADARPMSFRPNRSWRHDSSPTASMSASRRPTVKNKKKTPPDCLGPTERHRSPAWVPVDRGHQPSIGAGLPFLRAGLHFRSRRDDRRPGRILRGPPANSGPFRASITVLVAPTVFEPTEGCSSNYRPLTVPASRGPSTPGRSTPSAGLLSAPSQRKP